MKRTLLEQLVNAKGRPCSITLHHYSLSIFLEEIDDLGSSLGQKPFRLILLYLLDLYKYLDAYIDRHRGILLDGAKDPQTLFVKTVKTTSIDAAYNSTTFYELGRLSSSVAASIVPIPYAYSEQTGF